MDERTNKKAFCFASLLFSNALARNVFRATATTQKIMIYFLIHVIRPLILLILFSGGFEFQIENLLRHNEEEPKTASTIEGFSLFFQIQNRFCHSANSFSFRILFFSLFLVVVGFGLCLTSPSFFPFISTVKFVVQKNGEFSSRGRYRVQQCNLTFTKTMFES